MKDPTYKDLVSGNIRLAFEDDSCYYIRLEPKHEYDNTIWKVDKSTKSVSPMLLTSFFSIEPHTKQINPGIFKKPTELKHHGILGQKWGKRNGPPYPLKPGMHSSSEKKANKQTKKVDGHSNKQGSIDPDLALSIATLATIYGLPIAAMGVHKLNVRSKERLARKRVDRIIENIDNPKKNGFHTLSKPETIEESIKNTNPYAKYAAGQQNCTSCVVAGYLRQKGYDVVASPHAEPRNTLKLYKKCIRNFDECHRETTQAKIKNKESASKEILKLTNGKNGSGAITIAWANYGGGHIFSWEVKNGKVQFYDPQNLSNGISASDYFDRGCKLSNIPSQIFRFDNADFDFKQLRKLKVVE